MTSKIANISSLSAVLIVLVSVLAVSTASAGLVVGQDAANNTTTETVGTTTETEQPTQTAETCEPTSSEPKLSQSRLYAPEKTIEKGSPGRIAGGFQVDPTSQCPVVVHITMMVPSGMSIEGSADITSAGAGMVTARFTVQPGANIKDISAQVYSKDAGKRTVTADIQYWPVGHEEMAREIDGLSFTYDVQEPHTPTETESSESDNKVTENDDTDSKVLIDVPGFGVPAAVVALLGAVLLFRQR